MIDRLTMDLPDVDYIPADAMRNLAFSAVVTAGGLVFVSGVAPIQGPDFTVVGKGDLTAQCSYVLDVLGRSLEAAGSGPEGLIDITVYLVGTNEIGSMYTEIAPLIASFVGDARPSATAVGVTCLFLPEQLIEIRAVAKALP